MRRETTALRLPRAFGAVSGAEAQHIGGGSGVKLSIALNNLSVRVDEAGDALDIRIGPSGDAPARTELRLDVNEAFQPPKLELNPFRLARRYISYRVSSFFDFLPWRKNRSRQTFLQTLLPAVNTPQSDGGRGFQFFHFSLEDSDGQKFSLMI